MINFIWGGFIVLALVFLFITNNLDTVTDNLINSGAEALNMLMKIGPLLCIWLGIMKIAEKSGLLDKFANVITPVLSIFFKDIPKGDKAYSYMASNMIMNLFGLGNAATPFGLKAMKRLQELNKKKDTASNAMVTFLVLNPSGLTIGPTTVIVLRSMYKSGNPSEILLPCILVTIISTVGGLSLDYMARKWSK